MSKVKEKVTFFEETQIADQSVAQKLYDKECKWMKFKLICVGISLIGTILHIFELYHNNEFLAAIMLLGIIVPIISAPLFILKTCWNLIKIGWYIIPVFPLDLIVAPCFGVLSLYILFYAPVVYSLLSLLKTYKSKKAAELYLALDSNQY